MICKIEGTFITATTNAIKIRTPLLSGEAVQTWIPKSHISYKKHTPATGEMLLEIPVWMATAKRLDYKEKD